MDDITGTVVGRTHFKAQTVSLAPVGSKNCFLSKGFKLHVLASIITGQFLSKLFRIMQHRDIFIFNFKTIIRVFRFINCFQFLFLKELTKYQAK
jgi:hypothetical protein